MRGIMPGCNGWTAAKLTRHMGMGAVSLSLRRLLLVCTAEVAWFALA
jgi:hypothetical protein